jgi:predicted O-linked N-acetylglucosamine transferase (SPINDLY family)
LSVQSIVSKTMESAAEDEYRRGNALYNASDFAGALAAYDAALKASPQAAAAHYGRGNSLVMLRRAEEAISAFDRCLALTPHHPLAHYNRAGALVQLQRWQEALESLEVLVRSHPGMADAWNNRSGVLQALGRPDEALESLKPVLQMRPSDARAFYNAGILLLTLKRFDEAQQMLGRAFHLNPHHTDALGSLVSAALHACDWPALDHLLPLLLAKVREGSLVAPPLAILALSDDALLQRRCAELNLRCALADTSVAEKVAPLAPKAYDHPKIRIGYLSSDFGDHPVAAQIVGLLERHDRARFEISGLFTGREDGSARYRRIVNACDHFFPLGAMGSQEAADLIRNAEIDILVDLNGQTMGWRPAILKYRPAPVIATYLGYAGTMGADFVDYIIGDPHVTPFDLAPAMAEKITQLPDCFWPSDPDLPEPEALTRAEFGLPENAFVFCCFNSNHKIRPVIFDSWMRLLAAVPTSLLWIREGFPAMNARFRQQAQNRGIDPARIHFAGRTQNFARHLGRQAQADLFLDTWPYNAHATASDALWAGLPIVTLRGESFVSRVSASLLSNLGLDELIASTMEQYETIALSLAQDRERLAEVKIRLAEARRTAPLFDMHHFVRGIEAAYIAMQLRAQRGEPPAPLRVAER